jgi:DNA polymerase III subunit alpha
MTDFAHLHTHTHYSLLDGLGTPEAYVKRAKAMGQKHLAITDHGNLYGVYEFYKAAKKNDIHPVIGCEVYFADNRHEKSGGSKNIFHNIVLCENEKGFENLLQLITKANMDGFYVKPRIDWELLEQYSEGLIVTSGCLNSIISNSILSNREEEAIDMIKRYQKIVGKDNFFLEVQDHPSLSDQYTVNDFLYRVSDDLGAPLLATQDCHYIGKDQKDPHDVLLCIQTNSNVEDNDRMKFEDDFYLSTGEKMAEMFKDHEEALANSIKIAERCKVDFQFGQNLIPHFPTPDKKKPNVYLRELVVGGLFERYELKSEQKHVLNRKDKKIKNEDKEIVDRMNYELDMIHKMGFDEYFLIVWDFIKAARDKGIVVGPGRGSAAGAIISYCLWITNLDPLQYGLLFERFLNPSRVSMPDIDIDFQDDRRMEVLDYVNEKYGKEYVAQVITFGTMSAKAAVKDVGRAFGIPFQEMNQLTKLIPSRPGTKLADALESEVELKTEYDHNVTFQKVYDTALQLEGTIRQAGVHACAVIISKEPIVKYTALQRAPGAADTTITQHSMKPLESLGLLKMDFLGLRNLTIMKRALDIIKRRRDLDVDMDSLPIDDKDSYKLMAEARTIGVFQLESAGMRRYLKELIPTCFEDIIAMVSLFRPGPMDFIPAYIGGKHGTKEVKYVHDDLKDILSQTYGIAIYQEQILQIAQKFAGFSLGDADLLRRAIGKKIASELKAQRQKFIDGGVAQGYTKQLATDIFDKVIEPFANYGFNKSHAACYALIAYQTAYLKAHYPAEFMAALLTCDQENTDRVVIDIGECEEMGIKILPPDVNESLERFSVVDDQRIRYGLTAIKNLGRDTIETIVTERETNGIYKSLADLITRIPQKAVNKKAFEAMARSGALDQFADRNVIIESIDLITSFAKQHDTKRNADQTDIFGMMDEEHHVAHHLQLADARPATRAQKLAMEKEIMGIFVSDHPLKGLRKYMMSKTNLIGNLNGSHYEKEISIGGIVTSHKRITTKKGDQMMQLELDDLTGKMNCVIFPYTYKKIPEESRSCIGNDEYFFTFKGKLDRRGGEDQFIINDIERSFIDSMRENSQKSGVFDSNEKKFNQESHQQMTDVSPRSIGSPYLSEITETDSGKGVRDITDHVADFAKEQLRNSTENSFLDGQTEEITFRLRPHLQREDLMHIREILEPHGGDKPVLLDLVVDGKRQVIDTNLKINNSTSVLQELSSYLET